jgi:mannose-6-phosphate isomerase-like protein (cupin superfamily)
MNNPIVKHRQQVNPILAGDLCHLREFFHPGRDAVSLRYSIAYATVEPGGRSLKHLLQQSEVYYVIRGQGTMYLDGQPHAVQTGSCFYIPPHCEQWLQNDGDELFEFICIVDPPWTAEEEEILE